MEKTDELENLYLLQKSDIKKASIVAARCFKDGVVISTLIPDVNERLQKLPYSFSFILRFGLKDGEIYAPTKDIEGFAMWVLLNKGNNSVGFLDTIKNGGFNVVRKLGFRVVREILRSSTFKRNIHSKIIDKPHWHLQFLAVDPEHQGKGHASKLLRPMIARADREGYPIYLETQDERNVSIYQHFGFKIMDQSENPKWSMTNWGMLYEPKKNDGT